MNDLRAYQYYSRLLSLGVKQDLFIPLADVAVLLCSTPRHARTLLKALQQLKWLSWSPKVGRNQRSILHLNYALPELQDLFAEQLIAEGSYENALALLDGDQQRFTLLLQNTSGATLRKGQQHIQLTYQRVFDPLLPHQPLRNSERFLVRQIYDCLTTCDKNGKVQSQLAHHWQCNEDASEWRFYLRPQLKFHSNEIIDAQQVSLLFNKLTELPEYRKELSHLKNVYAQHQCIIFELNSPDLGFAALVSDLRYSIQPPSQVSEISPSTITGSGAFQVIEHSKKRLCLQAFDNYFALRALTDSVTIWQLTNTPSERIHLEYSELEHTQASLGALNSSLEITSDRASVNNNMQVTNVPLQKSTQSRIENGCLYLLFNLSHKKTALTQIQRKYLTRILSAELILQEDNLSKLLLAAVPAFNLLPCWTKIRGNTVEEVDLPKRLDIAIYDHLVILDCANALSKKLNQMGIESSVNIYSFADMHKQADQQSLQEEIIIGSINVDDNLPVSVFRWFYSNAIFQQGLSCHAKEWLNKELDNIRETKEVDCYLKELESIATTMIYENWLTPLFHHRQTLQWQGVLQGVAITDWSWPDFKNVWSDR